MKMKDIISENEAKEIDEDVCLLCETHKRAYKRIQDGISCSFCGTVQRIEIDDYSVVGMSNYYDPEHDIFKTVIYQCSNCGEDFALIPHKIIYNANHDVYYTGGNDYLNDDDEHKIFINAQKEIEASLKQWIERYENGEKLDPSYPALWIKRNITKAIAEYLFEKGLKK